MTHQLSICDSTRIQSSVQFESESETETKLKTKSETEFE